jgi:hypothetical protein
VFLRSCLPRTAVSLLFPRSSTLSLLSFSLPFSTRSYRREEAAAREEVSEKNRDNGVAPLPARGASCFSHRALPRRRSPFFHRFARRRRSRFHSVSPPAGKI